MKNKEPTKVTPTFKYFFLYMGHVKAQNKGKLSSCAGREKREQQNRKRCDKKTLRTITFSKNICINSIISFPCTTCCFFLVWELLRAELTVLHEKIFLLRYQHIFI